MDSYCLVARQRAWTDTAGRQRWTTSTVRCKVKDAAFWMERGYVLVFREPEQEPRFNPPRLAEE